MSSEEPTYDEMMKEANDIQEDDKTRVKGMIKTVANMEEVRISVKIKSGSQSDLFLTEWQKYTWRVKAARRGYK